MEQDPEYFEVHFLCGDSGPEMQRAPGGSRHAAEIDTGKVSLLFEIRQESLQNEAVCVCVCVGEREGRSWLVMAEPPAAELMGHREWGGMG